MGRIIMLDINKAVSFKNDPEGNMYGLEHWSPLIANQRAEAEGIHLTDEHWEILSYLRERYRVHGEPENARELLLELQDMFYKGESRRKLYELFPGGPISQGSRIAGLPQPSHANDLSFGSFE